MTDMNIPTPLLLEIASYLPKAQDPFSNYHRVKSLVSYPWDRHGITFEVGNSKRCKGALSDATNVFAFEGSIGESYLFWLPETWMPLFDSIEMTKEEVETVKNSFDREELPIEALLKVATPASFRTSGESVVDPELRNAFEITRDRLPAKLLEALALKGHESSHLKPYFEEWTYQLYKIYMYGPGVKFDDHVDALHSSDQVATVVLSLPSKHVGGVLKIRHHGEVVEFKSSKGPGRCKQTHSATFRYVSFFTDCTHSVQEVISGWRVVVQYDVYKNGIKAKQGCGETTLSEVQDANVDETIKDDMENDVANERAALQKIAHCLEYQNSAVGTNIYNKEQTEFVQAVVAYLAKLPPTHGAAFFLRHRYPLPSLNKVVLHGADRIIYDALAKRRDLSISVQGVLVYIYTANASQVSATVTAVSMDDFLNMDDSSDDGESESEADSTADSAADSDVASDADGTADPDADSDANNDADCDANNDPDAASSSYEKRKDAETPKISTFRLIVDSEIGATRLYKERKNGYSCYYAACMLIQSRENLNPAVKQRCL